jgi:hypothetical protein
MSFLPLAGDAEVPIYLQAPPVRASAPIRQEVGIAFTEMLYLPLLDVSLNMQHNLGSMPVQALKEPRQPSLVQPLISMADAVAVRVRRRPKKCILKKCSSGI